MTLDEAFKLFRRLGIDPTQLDGEELQVEYFRLAKRYHPDVGNQATNELMANINVARDTINRTYRSG
jgi:hypothetical protein